MHVTEAVLKPLETWVARTLPTLNNAVEDKMLTPRDLVVAIEPWMTRVRDSLGPQIPRLTRKEARKAIQLLGFCASSVERHYQATGLRSGTGLSQLSSIDDILGALSDVAQHPPRDTHYTYWLWNSAEEPLSFTGDSQEAFFHRVVNETNRLHTASCELLRPICGGLVSMASPEATLALQQAAQNSRELCRQFRSFLGTTEGRRPIEPLFFMMRMRSYLATYPINRTTWGGVNAANLAAQMQLDYIAGTVLDFYSGTVRDRLRYLTDEDQEALVADICQLSVTGALLEHLHSTDQDIQCRSVRQLADHLSTQSAGLRTAATAYESFIRANAQLTAAHWALIHNYLVKPSATLSERELAKLPVKAHSGTGGASHAETKAIMEMRRNHPVVGKLIAAIKLCRPTSEQESIQITHSQKEGD